MRQRLAVLLSTLGLLGSMLIVAGTAMAANPSANLDQCANWNAPGGGATNCSSADGTGVNNWINGNLGASKARYMEGDSVAYRLRFANLVTGTTVHTVIIEWDTTKGGKHALDYLTTWNRTVTGSDPTLGVSGLSGSPSTLGIPADGQVTGAGVTPVAGVFTMWGGQIESVGAYSYQDGTGFSGDKSARLEVSFTATAKNPVLAWGGHIATRMDWGELNSAVTIPGSPYHMRLIDLDGAGGNQDRSLSNEAVIFPARINIVKDVVGDDSTQAFAFTETATTLLTPSTFSLDDNQDATLSNTQSYTGITNFITYTFDETVPTHWTLGFNAPACTVTSANGGSQSLHGTTGVTINLKEGETVTCTFKNTHNVNSPTISTVVKNDADDTAITTSVPIGTVAYDTATLTGATTDAGGTVTYYVEKGDSQCTTTGATELSTETVTNGIVPDSDTTTFTSAGTYYFWAKYTPDANNDEATSGCLTEVVVVDKNGPTISTVVRNDADDTAITTSVPIGTVAYDTSSLTGATTDAGGTVTYYVEKGDSACTTAGATSLGVKDVSNGIVPDSDTTTFTTAGTYYFWAVYSGDDNNTGDTSGCSTEVVVVDKNGPTLTTQVKNDADDEDVANNANVSIGTVAYDTATFSGASNPTGTVTYWVTKGDATCSTDGATGLGAKTIDGTTHLVPDSDTYTFTSAGTYYFWADYPGDDNNASAKSGCLTEVVVVDQNEPSISTAVKNTNGTDPDTTIANNGHVSIGTVAYDTATLAEATADVGGTVTYYVEKGDSACTTEGATTLGAKTIDGTTHLVPDSDTYTFGTAGTYYFWAEYSGDDNNKGATSGCSTEIVVTDQNTPTLSTVVKNTNGTDPDTTIANNDHVSIGTVAYDTATFSDASNPTGTVTYYVEKGDALCTADGATSLGEKTIDGTTHLVPDSDTTTFTSAGTYYFWAEYSGDDNNGSATSDCSTEVVVVDKNGPTIGTTVKNTNGTDPDTTIANNGHVSIGTVAYDTSSLTGATTDAGGTVTYYVEKGDSACTTAGATSLGVKDVSNGIVPDSDTTTFTTAGTYYFWAEYSGDSNNEPATSGCSTEIVVTDKNTPTVNTVPSLVPNDEITIGNLADPGSNGYGTLTVELWNGTACGSGTLLYEVSFVPGDADHPFVGNGTYSTDNTTPVTADAELHWCTTYTGDDNNSAFGPSDEDEIISIDFNPVTVVLGGIGLGLPLLLLGIRLGKKRETSAG